MYKGKSQALFALIDSGAELCLFHSSVGRLLGIDLNSGKKEKIKGISASEIPAYIHTVHLILKGESGIDIEAGFLDADLIADGGILGQEGFFDQFDIRFQRWQDSIHITRRS